MLEFRVKGFLPRSIQAKQEGRYSIGSLKNVSIVED
jgi:hypothetical protein